MTKLQTVNRMLSYLTALLLPLLAGCGRADNPECMEYVNSIGLRNMPEGYAAYAVTSANHIFSIDLQSRSALYVKSLPPHCVNTAAKLDIVLNRDDVPCLFFANEDELIRMSPSIWDGRIDIIELRKNGRKMAGYRYLDADTISGWIENPDAPKLFRLLPVEMNLDTGDMSLFNMWNPISDDVQDEASDTTGLNGKVSRMLDLSWAHTPDVLHEYGEMDFNGYRVALKDGRLSVDGAEASFISPSIVRQALLWRFPAGLLIILFAISVFIFLVVYPFIVKKKGERAFENYVTMRAERERFLVKMSDSVYASVSGNDLMKMYDDVCSNLNVDDMAGISGRTKQWEKFESMLSKAAGYIEMADCQCFTDSVTVSLTSLSEVVKECRSARMDRVGDLSGRLETALEKYEEAVVSESGDLLGNAVRTAGVPVLLRDMLLETDGTGAADIVERVKSIISASKLWKSLSNIGDIVSALQEVPDQDRLKYLNEEFYMLKSLDTINSLQDKFKEECSVFYLNLGKADEAALEIAGLGARTSFFRYFILLLVFIDYSSRIGMRDIAILANSNLQTVSARKSELVNRKLKGIMGKLSGDMSAMAIILKAAYANLTTGKNATSNFVNDKVTD